MRQCNDTKEEGNWYPSMTEMLYNGICLPKDWPPKNLSETSREPLSVPYLKNPPSVIPINVGRQVFVDDFLIEHTTLHRSFHTPRLYEHSPILKPETSLEMNNGICPVACPFNDGVFYDPKDQLLMIGFSRDGFHWDRTNRHPFIASSQKEGTWNRAYLHSAGGSCLIVGDEIYFYFGAWSGLSPKLGGHMYAGGSTGLALLRRDGFASLDADTSPGSLTTRLVTFKGKYLFVNTNTKDGELRVEILDQNDQVIVPFSSNNCHSICTNKTMQMITWQDVEDVSPLIDKPVKFKFDLTNGQLYSFWVSPDLSGASYGCIAAGGPGFTGPVDTIGVTQYH